MDGLGNSSLSSFFPFFITNGLELIAEREEKRAKKQRGAGKRGDVFDCAMRGRRSECSQGMEYSACNEFRISGKERDLSELGVYWLRCCE